MSTTPDREKLLAMESVSGGEHRLVRRAAFRALSKLEAHQGVQLLGCAHAISHFVALHND